MKGKVPGKPVNATVTRLSTATGTFVTVQTLVLRVVGNVLMQPEPGLLMPPTNPGAPVPRKRLKLWADWPSRIRSDNKQIAQSGDRLIVPPNQKWLPLGYDGTYPIDDCLSYVGHHVELYITRPQHLVAT